MHFLSKNLNKFQKLLENCLFFKKSYTRNGLFKGRKNFLVVTASSYVKLQQAYISEAVAVGNWQIIGYKGPGENTKGSATGGDKSGTTNFKYADAETYVNNTVALDNTERAGFVAANQAKLNDCAAKSGDASSSNYNWKVTVKKSTSSEGDAVFTSTTNCTELTPNFAKIGG